MLLNLEDLLVYTDILSLISKYFVGYVYTLISLRTTSKRLRKVINNNLERLINNLIENPQDTSSYSYNQLTDVLKHLHYRDYVYWKLNDGNPNEDGKNYIIKDLVAFYDYLRDTFDTEEGMKMRRIKFVMYKMIRFIEHRNHMQFWNNKVYDTFFANSLDETDIKIIDRELSNVKDSERNLAVEISNITWIKEPKIEDFFPDVIDKNQQVRDANYFNYVDDYCIEVILRYYTDKVDDIPTRYHLRERIILNSTFDNILLFFDVKMKNLSDVERIRLLVETCHISTDYFKVTYDIYCIAEELERYHENITEPLHRLIIQIKL